VPAEEETRVDVPASVADRRLGETVVSGTRTGPSFKSLPGQSSDTLSSPVEALRREEVGRLHALTSVMRWLSVAMIATLPFFGGNSALRYVLIGGLALGIPMGYWFQWVISKPGGLTPERMTATAVGLGVNGYVGILFFGVFSGATTIVVLSLFIASRTEFLNSAFLLYLLSAVAEALFGGLIISGVMDDPGLITLGGASVFEAIFMILFLQCMYFGAFMMGKASRKMTIDAIDELEGARRQVGQRDALLNEARNDLDHALQVVGGPGRYTEQTIGSFKLGVIIGRGAMAEVYEAHHTETNEPAAIKLLHQNLLAEPRAVARFIREARAAAALDSPHVARIVEASDPLEPLPYLAMERLSGNDLAHFLRHKPIMSMSKVLELIEQVADVVDRASEAGIVHRDLKPQNLFLAEQPTGKPIWKVLDFGVSFLAEGSGTLTQGNVVGTPSYMSPEQARGGAVDQRTDIHALTAIAYRCLTGRPPFTGRDIPQVMYAAVHSMPEQPSVVADVTPEVEAVIAVGLAKRREDRFESGAKLVEALESAARGQLDPKVRDLAMGLLAELPWGARD